MLPQLTELAGLLRRFAVNDGINETPVPGLLLLRASTPNQLSHVVQQPSFCIIASCSKEVTLNGETYVYRPGQYLFSTVALPVTACIHGGSSADPYLCFCLNIDPREVADLVIKAGPKPARATGRGLFVADVSAPVLDASLRITRLLESPDDIATLAPLLMRELLYRLLKEEHGWRLAQMALADGHVQRVGKAINWMREHFSEPLSIPELARSIAMSTSAFHQHFKAVTAMSPLQYQKLLRLQEARRLLLTGNVDAAEAGHNVGYESPSQFSREYSRYFGAPPARDMRRMRETQALSA